MKYLKYTILIILLFSCTNQEKKLKSFGCKNDFEKYNGFGGFEFKLNTYKNYGDLVDFLNSKRCDDFGQYLKLESEHYICGVYPILVCDPPPWRALSRNTFYIKKGGIFKNNTKLQGREQLHMTLQKDLTNFGQDPEFADDPRKILFLVEYDKNDSTEGILEQLKQVIEVYDALQPEGHFALMFQIERYYIPLPQEKDPIQ